jgi:hypothetical protein
VADEVKNGVFKVAGGKPGQKVSWQVTGIRKDAYAKAHPIVVETDKVGEERGTLAFVPKGSRARPLPIPSMERGPEPRLAKPQPAQLPQR